MFDFAWSELALIAAVALVVIGPKDLPRVLRTVGFWVRQARGIAREFQGSLEQMVRDAELDDVKKDIEKVSNFNFEREMQGMIDPDGDLQRSLSEPALTNPLIDHANTIAPPPTTEAPPAIPAPPASEAALPSEVAEALPVEPKREPETESVTLPLPHVDHP